MTMTDTLNIAVSGLNNAAARIANSASSIVNASSTKNISNNSSGDLTANLVAISADKTVFAANAAVVKAVAKNNKTLIDMIV